MQTNERTVRWALAGGLVLAQLACGSGGSAVTDGTSGGNSFGGASAGGSGEVSSGGTVQEGTSGSASVGGMSGGRTSGSGGSAAGGAGGSAAASTGGLGGAGTSAACTVGAWPAADPAAAGPFATVTDVNVGPATDGVAFTMFRPKDFSPTLCHPIVTWGNGTGSTPSLYKVMLNHLASHGFVVIASDSMNVGQGSPAPMLNGVTWVLAQNEDPVSPLYRHLDVAHIGATGHSQGGFATSTASGDQRITASAPLCGASMQRNLRGPAWLFCGGADTAVPCSTVQSAFNSINTQPAMLARLIAADHANWVTFRGTKPSAAETAMTAWMRVHLMDDTALRSWFYGPSCKLCTDSAWEITQKMMDQ
jgi:dienelactone hydrolase